MTENRIYDLYILDLDGTVYRGNEILPGVIPFIESAQSLGSQIIFLTNNSSVTNEGISQKLNALGVPCEPSQCYGTAALAARWCQENQVSTAYVLGSEALSETLHSFGIRTKLEPGERADAVIAGICRNFSYELLNEGLQHLLQGAEFVATNTDATYPLEKGAVQPGAGAMVAALSASSGRVPIVLGKPSPLGVETILRETGITPANTLVVGDRFETDIAAGRAAGCDTWLVLTGVTHEAPPGVPHGNSLLDLLVGLV